MAPICPAGAVYQLKARFGQSRPSRSQLATLIYEVFREPSGNEELEKPRIHFGLGVELMRRGAILYIAKTARSGEIIGYILGYEVLRESNDPRDIVLSQIAGTHALDYLFERGKRVFYVDGLGVALRSRRRYGAERLSPELIDVLRKGGFTYRLGRTEITAKASRGLFTKLGFQELSVHDTSYPERTYWLLRL